MWEFKYKVQFKMQAAGHIQKQRTGLPKSG